MKNVATPHQTAASNDTTHQAHMLCQHHPTSEQNQNKLHVLKDQSNADTNHVANLAIQPNNATRRKETKHTKTERENHQMEKATALPKQMSDVTNAKHSDTTQTNARKTPTLNKPFVPASTPRFLVQTMTTTQT
jgi:hypothetical protein